MIEQVIELRIKSKIHLFRNLKSFAYVEVGPPESRCPESIASQVAVLTVLCIRRRETSEGSGIDYRLERIRVQPLDRARQCYARDGSL